jgi:hypothetical protein
LTIASKDDRREISEYEAAGVVRVIEYNSKAKPPAMLGRVKKAML